MKHFTTFCLDLYVLHKLFCKLSRKKNIGHESSGLVRMKEANDWSRRLSELLVSGSADQFGSFSPSKRS